jgi:hypothetical protein
LEHFKCLKNLKKLSFSYLLNAFMVIQNTIDLVECLIVVVAAFLDRNFDQALEEVISSQHLN